MSVGLLLLALQPPIVIWAMSGLENALYLCLLAALLDVSFAARRMPGRELLAAAIAAAVALTRPEGILFAALFPMALATDSSAITRARRCAIYVAGVAAIFGAFLIWRHQYYGAWVANTYLAKFPTAPPPRVDHRLLEFLAAICQKWIIAFALATIGVLGLILDRSRTTIILAAGTTIGLIIFCALPPDWMREFRFATAGIFFAELWIAVSIGLLARAASAPWIGRTIQSVGYGALVFLTATFTTRTRAFSAEPPVPIAMIADAFGTRYNAIADALDIQDGSLLVPDLGGTLLTTRLRILDLAGLCDPVIARTRIQDPPAFFDYVFERERPTFIHTHNLWAQSTHFDDDSRFRRDYVPIVEGDDAYLWTVDKVHVLAGDYVRRDAIGGRESRLPAAVAILRGSPFMPIPIGRDGF